MSLKALVLFLFSFATREPDRNEETHRGELPRWERTPAERQHLRQQDQSAASAWLRLLRGY